MLAGAILLLAAGQTVKFPVQLNNETFSEVRAYATPTKRDLGFQTLDWKPTVLEGINEGNRLDKPILLWLYFGDPRGHC
jgi:hypothetical protein